MNAVDVADYVASLLPPIADIMRVDEAKADDDLSPFVTLPAIYIHIIIQGYRAEVLSRKNEAMAAIIAKGELKPKEEMTDDETDALSIWLATEAADRSFAAIEGAAALWKAAAITMVANMSGDTMSAFDGMCAIIRADIAQAIGVGATQQ
ncbi:hypothetical protein ACKU27_01150 [Sphingobium yanoikuyae]|uniref:Uncharacterized protein n=1 Tax=Sphingobium yanoikuyae TaxID=13690 RepID=A0A6M4G1N4_SPHYA|nr:hypothetical protein [Sphingobium yanoikuyae]QJR01165.1 hypothetical protein HH800_02480 [Sphingobium yanoikuyae]